MPIVPIPKVRGPANRETDSNKKRNEDKKIRKKYETIFPNWMEPITIAEMQEAISAHDKEEWAKHEAAQLAKRIERQTQSAQLPAKTN